MSDRDDFAELIGMNEAPWISSLHILTFALLVGSARNVIKGSSFYFNGRIRYGTKGEKVEERLLVSRQSAAFWPGFLPFSSVWMQSKSTSVQSNCLLKYAYRRVKRKSLHERFRSKHNSTFYPSNWSNAYRTVMWVSTRLIRCICSLSLSIVRFLSKLMKSRRIHSMVCMTSR